MNHVLDNPAWNALTSGNSNLANGNETVKHFAKEVSPFVGFKETSDESFQTLYELITHDNPVVFIASQETEIPTQWQVLRYIKCLQMIADDRREIADSSIELVLLTNEHIPQMLALTKLTNPGPFAERTIDFGHYRGIFDGDKLIAMAGQRMNPEPYAEISAVCTHPDYLGRGHAARLLLYHIERIKATGGIPYLNVLTENARAIAVYESLGFVTRKQMPIYTIHKK